jgi:hypothetical protein
VKRILSYVFIFLIFLSSCKNQPDILFRTIGNENFSLYWHHDASFEKGRYLLFELTSVKGLKNLYNLKFEYFIEGQNISVRLIGAEDTGACPRFPGENSDICYSRGKILIPERLLPPGKYNFAVITANTRTVSELVVTEEKLTLNIPSNSGLSCGSKDVFPLPKNMLYGAVVYEGPENGKLATAFINEMDSLGLKPATLPNHPYRALDVATNYHLHKTDWEPDNHSISLLYIKNKDFKTIFELAQKYAELSDNQLTMGLFTSNGDEAHLGGYDGNRVYYAPQ